MDNLAKKIKSADEGNIDAMVEVADYILWEDETVPVEPEMFEKAVNYLKKAIEAGNTQAMISYGAVFYNGRGVPQDFNTAVHWYKEAADRGNIWAIGHMGYMYYYGRGDLEVNMEKAYEYFSKAAMLGVPNAYYKCGDMFLDGKYVEKDPKTAFSLFSICYNMIEDYKPLDCYPDVCRRLGTCYHKGIGTDKNLEIAEKFLAEAKLFFKKRKDSGNIFTDEVLKIATQEWLEVMRELDE
ncbi:MAG: tetratricopeptide repeat protein [Acutalibacteraceae bacterium]